MTIEVYDMFNIRMDTIRERTTNGPTYMKGRQYYRQGHVKHLVYDQDKGIIVAQVEGSRMYTVRIILNSQGELHDATCTCSAFAAYWGLCRHIAATLLYCIDKFSDKKKDAAGRPRGNGKSAEINAVGEFAETASSDREAALKTALQSARRNRSKTKEFLNRMELACQLVTGEDKKQISFQVTLICQRTTASQPWLSFAVGTDRLFPVTNVEQFAEAISRALPLELDRDFTLNLHKHIFREQDMPLVRMLQDAFENDYKAVFGTTQASSKDQYFLLNASRLAEFLNMADKLSDCSWLNEKDNERLPIQVKRGNLPLSLLLVKNRNDFAADNLPFSLVLHLKKPILQLTASRNVYLVGDEFFLPPVQSIRLLEPILTTFMKPGFANLDLTREDAIMFISDIQPRLQDICPVHIEEELSAKVVNAPLHCTIEMDFNESGLKAHIIYQYANVQANPIDGPLSDSAVDPYQLIIRDRSGENQILQILQKAGFSRHGNYFLLSDPGRLYAYLRDIHASLKQSAEIRMTAPAKKLRVDPPPFIRFHFDLDEKENIMAMRQTISGLKSREYSVYINALRDKRPYFRREDGSFQEVDLSSRDDFLKMVDLLKLWGIRLGITESRIPHFRILSLYNLVETLHDKQLLVTDPAIDQYIKNLRDPEITRFRLPAAVNSRLRPYQKTGFRWLCTLHTYGFGGILADDMGLGKTLQTIAFVAWLWQKQKKPSLVIAPTSLIYNWASEFEKFAPRLPVLIIDGNRQQRSSLLENGCNKACYITSYSLLRRDIDVLSSLKFASCFLDEAQNIKNPDTLNARSVKQLQAERYFALTGTPIENSLTELWSIFDYIMPGYLFTHKKFQTYYENPITRDNSNLKMRELQQQTDPFILRRMKKDVLQELPEKIETRTICDMTSEQRQLYDSFLEKSKRDLEAEIKTNGYAGSQIFILALLTRLRQICCHPGLFMPDYRGGSGKMLLLEELLADSFSAGHRVLVFSQFTSMLEIIRENQQQSGDPVFYIDGQVDAETRMTQVQRFNEGEGRLFLISLRAGGTGLNLTGADTVIHYDPWWNPAVEEQATDRAYRIGQENIVQVLKLYTRNSVEDKIHLLQQKKKQLIDTMIRPGQNLLSKMTLDEVRSLFNGRI